MTKFLWSLGLGLFFTTSLVWAETGSIVRLKFVNSERVVATGALSEVLTVQTQNGGGEAEDISSTADVTFTSSSDTGEFLNQSGQPVSTVMAKNSANRNFYYRDSDDGEHTLTVTVTIRDGGESWTAEQDITIGDEPEDEEEDSDDEETNDDQDEDEEEDVEEEDDSGNDEDEGQEDDDDEEEEDEEEVKEVKKEEKKKVVTPKPETKPEGISPELLLKLKMALAPQVVPVVAPSPVVKLEPEPVEKVEPVEEKPEPIIVSAETQLAAAIVATNTLPTVLSNESVDGPIVIEKKPTVWQRFCRWLFGD